MTKDYLANTVKDCLHVFDTKRQKNKFLAFGLKLSAAILSATITVLLGLSFPGKNDVAFKNIALVLSALSTVVAAWDAFFQHRTLWIRYTIAANRMRSLLEEINYRVDANGGALPASSSDALFLEFQDIVAAANNSWEIMKKSQRDNVEHDDRDA